MFEGNDFFCRTLNARQTPIFQKLETCAELEDWVRRHQFTFIVGPGCARVGWDQPKNTWPVAVAMARIYASLDGPDRDFLARLAATKHIDLTLSWQHYPENEVERLLRPLRESFVRIARLATAILYAGLLKWGEPVDEWNEVRVVLGDDDDCRRFLSELGTAQRVLVEVREICLGQTQAADDGRIGSGAQAWKDLSLLFGGEGIEASLKMLKSGSPLSGAQVEWLTNLVWHSFRYAAAWPPSNGELAFQLGISWANQPGLQVRERAHATQAHQTQTGAVDTLRAIYRAASASAGEEQWSDRDRLFKALAQLAIRPLPTLTNEEEQSATAEVDSDLSAFDGVACKRYRVFYSSSLDTLLEDAILKAIERQNQVTSTVHPNDNLVLHLIVPVLVTNKVTGFEEVGWLLGSVGPDHSTEWQRYSKEEVLLRGPVVVKLNGDPGSAVAKVRGVDGKIVEAKTTGIERLVVLSEFQHLTLLLAETNMLFRWLEGRGPEQGSFILLGESVDEWSIRQRLFGQTMFPFWSDSSAHKPKQDGKTSGEERPKELDFRAISINHKADLVRHSLFAWVRLREYEGDLAEVGVRLNNVLKELRW